MSRFSRAMALLAVPVLFAACSPGSTDTPFSPPVPRHDGLLVGGNAEPTDSTQAGTTTTSTSSDTGMDPGPGAVPPDTTGRGLLVGGN